MQPAVIVGGGPAGALLAYILASRGVSVTLVERQSDFAREFRGEGLSPGGQLMFREAGLWDEFDQLPHTQFNGADIYFKARPLVSIQLEGLMDPAPRWVSQPAMLEMLVEQASAFPGFTFHRGVRVVGPLIRDGRVEGVELSGPDGHEPLEASYVFACDGRFSVLRKEAGMDQARRPQFFDIVWCKMPMPDIYGGGPPRVRGYTGNGHFGLFIPSYDNLLQVGWVIKKGAYADFRAMGIERWMEEVARHVSPDLAAHLRANAHRTSHPFLLDVVCDCYDRWNVPGMTLVGDAAHPMSPVGAQGINIALRDSVVAANHFLPPLLDATPAPEKLDAAAQAFRAERVKEVAPIQAAQRRAPIVMFGTGLWLDALMWSVGALYRSGVLPWVASRTNLARNPFASGVTEVTLTV